VLALGAFESDPAVPSKVDWVRPKGLVFRHMQSPAVMASEQLKVARTCFRKMTNGDDYSVIVRNRPQSLVECPVRILA
jgi:hypothetical protein